MGAVARPTGPHGADEILRIVGQEPDGITIEQIGSSTSPAERCSDDLPSLSPGDRVKERS